LSDIKTKYKEYKQDIKKQEQKLAKLKDDFANGVIGIEQEDIDEFASLIDDMKSDESFASDVAAQIYDNAMIQAGLVVDPMVMVERNYKILNKAVGA